MIDLDTVSTTSTGKDFERRIRFCHVLCLVFFFLSLKLYIDISGQISIIPKPELFGDFGEVPLLNHHLG